MTTTTTTTTAPASTAKPTTAEQEAYEIALEAYTYLYPLVLMDTSRRQATNVEAGKTIGRGPMNNFTHLRAFPDSDFATWYARTSTPSIPSPGSTSPRNPW